MSLNQRNHEFATQGEHVEKLGWLRNANLTTVELLQVRLHIVTDLVWHLVPIKHGLKGDTNKKVCILQDR